MFKLFLYELRSRRNAILGWGLGIGAYLAMIIAMSPDLAPQFANLDLSAIPIYRAFGLTEDFLSLSSLVSVYVSFLGMIIAVYGVIIGANALAGEEDEGTLENILTLPVSRVQIVLAKALAISVALWLVLGIAFLGHAAAFPSVKADLEGEISLWELFVSTMESWPLALFFAMLALFMGAYLPRRSQAMGVGLTVLIGGYLFNNLAQQAGPLQDFRQYTPFYYNLGGKVLTEGLNWGYMAILTGASLGLLGLAVLSFQRRDVTVGAWPWARWQRP